MRRSTGGASRKDHRARARRGLTLIEMLVATAITLLMMAAVATIFDQFGRSVNDSRATVEMSARLRDVRIRLQNDLDGLTTSPVPWLRPEADPGYLEIDEGARTDQSPTLLVLSADSSLLPTNDRTPQADFDSAYGLSGLGDADDILMMTVRSTGAPFTGRALASDGTRTVVQSQVAEVFWYAVENPADGSGGEPGLRTLYRRVLLVLPTKDAGLLTAANTPAPLDEMEFYRNFDVSAHRDENGLWAPNTLGDLTKRENRFAHDPGVGAFPHPLNTLPIRGGVDGSPHYTSSGTLRPFGSYEPHLDGPWAPERTGEDLVMTGVLAFDVRVYDPDAPILGRDTATAPGDPGFNGQTLVGKGAYVDLGYAGSSATASALGQANRLQTNGVPYAFPNNLSVAPRVFYNVYDTWSYHYEQDGLDEDKDGVADEGIDGFDSDANGVVDDVVTERETHPPYDVPLQGIEIRIRAYETYSRQVREVSVVRGFAGP